MLLPILQKNPSTSGRPLPTLLHAPPPCWHERRRCFEGILCLFHLLYVASMATTSVMGLPFCGHRVHLTMVLVVRSLSFSQLLSCSMSPLSSLATYRSFSPPLRASCKALRFPSLGKKEKRPSPSSHWVGGEGFSGLIRSPMRRAREASHGSPVHVKDVIHHGEPSCDGTKASLRSVPLFLISRSQQ